MSKPYIGGQAVLEGVMMRSPDKLAIAVRRASDKGITVSVKPLTPATQKSKLLGWPVVRGVVAFIDSIKNGMGTISESAKMAGDDGNIEEPSRFEKWLVQKLGKHVDDVVMGIAVVIAITLAIGLFFILPSLVASWLSTVLVDPTGIWVNLLEGGVRLVFFLAYVLAVGQVKDIKRVFRYHGAEHKTVHCYEHDEELTVDNCRKYSIMHPRCGTAFLLLVMVIAILFFSAIGALLGLDGNPITRVLVRLAFLPVVAGLSYELLRALGKYENGLVRFLRWPGMQLQRLTAKEPDDEMLEVAIAAMKAAAGLDTPAQEAPAGTETEAKAEDADQATPNDSGINTAQ